MTGNPEKNLAERLRPIIQRYAPILQELYDAEPNAFFSANYWTPLKLYCLAAYIHSCYVPIISKNPSIQKRIGDRFYFVDLLSNSGINIVCNHKDCEPEPSKCAACKRESKTLTVGSPLIAATANPPFKKLYFVDMNSANIAALEKRLSILKKHGMCQSDTECVEGDCNSALERILSEIRKSGEFHLLAFVDNEGLDADWETVNKLLDAHFSDLVINFPTSSLNRNIHNNVVVSRFLGVATISELHGQKPLEYYVNKIRSKGRTVETISVKSGKAYHYDLIIVTKKDAKFAPAIQFIKRNVESNSAKEAETAFDILKQRQRTLAGF